MLSILFPISGILTILISWTINLQYDIADAAAISETTDTQAEESYENTCNTTSCIDNAKLLRGIMNPELDPCDDFYQFVCGGFIKAPNFMGVELETFGMRELAYMQAHSNEYFMFNEDINTNDLSAVKKLKTYYRNCRDESRTEEEGTEPLFKIINNIGGWPMLIGENWNATDFAWQETVYKIYHNLKLLWFPMVLDLSINKENNTNVMLKVMATSTHFSNSYFLDGSGEILRNAYYNYMVDTAAALGADKNSILKEVKDVFDFEVNLFQIKTDDSLEILEKDNIMTLNELSQMYPTIPWLELCNKVLNISGIHVDKTEAIIVTDPQYIRKIEKLIEITPKRVLANYLAWRLVDFTLAYMPREFRELKSNFFKQIGETEQSVERGSECIDKVKSLIPIAASAMYVRKHFDQDIKRGVREIFNNIKNHTKKNLEEINWMDDKTRKAAIEKLEAIRVTIGHADELMDDEKVDGYYKNLEINPGSYLQSDLNINAFLKTEYYKNLKKSIDVNDWTEDQTALRVNAYYNPQTNSIKLPAAYLQDLIFKSDRPQYLNYAHVGTAIGHEIIHAFDIIGRKFDKNGNMKNWWEPDTEEKFLKQTQCLIQQYNNFTVQEVGLQVNGTRTLDENIADNGGFKAAYHAYNEWAKSNNITEKYLPTFKYTPRQMFWIGATSSWCSKSTPEFLRKLLTTKTHCPDNSRFIISFSNIKEFAEDFECKPGSKMNPKEKCVLW